MGSDDVFRPNACESEFSVRTLRFIRNESFTGILAMAKIGTPAFVCMALGQENKIFSKLGIDCRNFPDMELRAF